ncbi:MAG: M64 family metallopeptidase, partial [Terriglobales bacterium]
YEAKGYYRPEVDCIMFTRHKAFCAVCRRAIERVIGMYTG